MALTQNQIERARAIRSDIDGRISDNADNPDVLLSMTERIREWTQDAYIVGDVRRFGDKIYRCIQSHDSTGNATWTPDITPALWVVVQIEPEDGGILQWVAGEAVKVGDKRIYDGNTYECIQAHTTQAGWTPPVTATLWKKL